MSNSSKVLIVLGMLMLLALAAACGGTESASEPEAAETAATAAPAPTVAPPPEAVEPTAEIAQPAEEPTPEELAGGINSFQDVKQAIVQIESQGSFIDPAEGLQLNSAGRGSGFIIDESGIAVTNNHVVTGAAFLKVWVGGDDEPLNAQVLGVSECSDLAVIDIEGDGFASLDWFDGPAEVGTEIYVAGFPLGDPEYTLTRGIVSKAEAGGDTSWSAVDHVIEYDATTNPGNSGGAVVDENGKVVAVHYKGYGQARQAFGISHDVAEAIVEQLRQGEDVLSVGINGQAIDDGEGLTGIWVSSVKSGSPADLAGVKGGDIITAMEGLVLATDGTMADYCNILRGHHPEDVLGIEVLRFDTQELLEGQLNGRPLETVFSFAEEIAEAEGGEQVAEDTQTYTEFVTISDESEAIVMEVPAEWTDIDGSAWISDEDGAIIGGTLSAAPNLIDFSETYGVPGVKLIASSGLGGADIGELLDAYDYSAACTYDGRTEYDDSVYRGQFDLYLDCGETDSIIAVVAAKPEDQSHAVIVEAQAISDADVEAIDQILKTFNVVGALPDA